MGPLTASLFLSQLLAMHLIHHLSLALCFVCESKIPQRIVSITASENKQLEGLKIFANRFRPACHILHTVGQVLVHTH